MSSPLQGLMILVIDDHRDTVDMLTAYLKHAGAMAVGAESAVDGLAASHQHRFDAVLLDLNLPGQRGDWFVRQLHAVGRPVPVFAVTGMTEPADHEFAGYFLKPVDLDALVARLSRLPRRPS